MGTAAQKLAEEWDIPVEFVLEALEQTQGYWRWTYVASVPPEGSKLALRRELVFRSDASARKVRTTALGLVQQQKDELEDQNAY